MTVRSTFGELAYASRASTACSTARLLTASSTSSFFFSPILSQMTLGPLVDSGAHASRQQPVDFAVRQRWRLFAGGIALQLLSLLFARPARHKSLPTSTLKSFDWHLFNQTRYVAVLNINNTGP